MIDAFDELSGLLELLNNVDTKGNIIQVSNITSEAFKNGGKLFLCGNGGSAAEAQHMAAEYVATLDHRNFRDGLPALALTVDTSFLTAWTNDFGYEKVFARQLSVFGALGDVLFAYSTSGNSKNVLRACEHAVQNGIKVIGFAGDDGGKLKQIADICFIVPSKKTARIQEIHTLIGHIICGHVEAELRILEVSE
jgi:D-sedoheptulose 7-phosphate isomerase